MSPAWGPVGTEIEVQAICEPADDVRVQLQHRGAPPSAPPPASWEGTERYPVAVDDVEVDPEGHVVGRVVLPEAYEIESELLIEVYVPFESGHQLLGAVSCDGGGSWELSADRFTVADAAFMGVPEGHPFHDEIAWAGAEGVSTGYVTGEFGPERPVTRQAMVAYLYRLAGSAPISPFTPQVFADVPISHPFFGPTFWACDCVPLYEPVRSIAHGYPDGTFRPGDVVTREAAAVFLYRWAGEPAIAPPEAPTFDDVPSSHPFYDAIEWAAAAGIVEGYPGGSFKPTSPVSRQAAAAFVFRLDAVLS